MGIPIAASAAVGANPSVVAPGSPRISKRDPIIIWFDFLFRLLCMMLIIQIGRHIVKLWRWIEKVD